MKEKLELEYTLRTTPKVLYSRLHSPSGLSEWFADDVDLRGNVYTFIWDDATEKAELLSAKENKYVRFKWVSSEPADDENFFEFRIDVDELTKELALVITDFTAPEEKPDSIDLWNKQISELKRALGV
jgi:uncharacterized protein YndB with AHSA1/START domain